MYSSGGMHASLPTGHAVCWAYTGRIGKLSDTDAMGLAIFLFILIPVLARLVFVCRPTWMQRPWCFSEPWSQIHDYAALKRRFFIATFLLVFEIAGLVFLCLAIQVFQFCGQYAMWDEIYWTVWALVVLMPGALTFFACVVWVYMLVELRQSTKPPVSGWPGHQPDGNQQFSLSDRTLRNTTSSDYERADMWLHV